MMRKRGSREGEGVAEGSFEGKKREGALEWEEGGLETNDDPEMTEKEMKLRWTGWRHPYRSVTVRSYRE